MPSFLAKSMLQQIITYCAVSAHRYSIYGEPGRVKAVICRHALAGPDELAYGGMESSPCDPAVQQKASSVNPISEGRRELGASGHARECRAALPAVGKNFC